MRNEERGARDEEKGGAFWSGASAVRGMLGAVPRPVLLFLVLLSAIALLPWDPQGPLDARDWSHLEGVRLEYPWSGVLMEPLLAPANAFMGAPDFRIALLSSAAWVLALAFIAGAAKANGIGRRLGRGLAWSLTSLGGLTLYVVFVGLLHLPGWRLVADDHNLLVADLQTHTFGSHDGLATAEQNFAWHKERGYDLVGMTEHNDPRGSFQAEALAQAGPHGIAVVPGVEVSEEEDKFLLGIGIDPAKGVLPWRGNEQDFARKFIADVHAQGGAVIALAWKLEPRHVGKLVSAGIDGIELVNTGHPDIPDSVRAAMLEAAQHRALVLLASTDWHGWGGFTRTWTLISLPEASVLSPEKAARAVVDKLRAREAGAFIPVAAGYMGPPSMLRAIFSPFAEGVRYAAELSPARVISWWVWLWLAAIGSAALKKRNVRPAFLGGALLLTSIGASIALRAAALLTFCVDGQPHEYALEMGTPALSLAVISLSIAALLLFLERRRLRKANYQHEAMKHAL